MVFNIDNLKQPKKTKISISIPVEVNDFLNQISGEMGVSKSALICQALQVSIKPMQDLLDLKRKIDCGEVDPTELDSLRFDIPLGDEK